MGGFHYVVVDEIVGSSVGLALSAWPELDAQGRLLFGATDVYLLRCFAVQVRPEALERVIEELDEQQRLEPFLAPESWIEPPVYDVTADARDAAKVAFYAAVTPTLDADEAAPLAELLLEES
jgi:hypothetical protein